MILDALEVIKADATMQTLLKNSSANRKIFPNSLTKKHYETTPAILYRFETTGSADDLLESGVIEFVVLAKEYDDGDAIAKRIIEIFDLQDGVEIPSTYYHIYYGKHVGGNDQQEATTGNFALTRLFQFKFKRIGGP